MYRDYYISSLKIEFRPTNLYGGGNAFRIDSLTCGTSMDTILGTPMLPGSFNAALDAKMFDVQKPFKRFYRVAKYARAKSVIWRSCNDALTGPNGGFNVLPNC